MKITVISCCHSFFLNCFIGSLFVTHVCVCVLLYVPLADGKQTNNANVLNILTMFQNLLEYRVSRTNWMMLNVVDD